VSDQWNSSHKYLLYRHPARFNLDHPAYRKLDVCQDVCTWGNYVPLVTHCPAHDFSLSHLVNLEWTRPKLSSSDDGADGTHLYSDISPSTKSLLPHRFHGVHSGFELLFNAGIYARYVGARYWHFWYYGARFVARAHILALSGMTLNLIDLHLQNNKLCLRYIFGAWLLFILVKCCTWKSKTVPISC
jgi:hypothetical protein